MKRNSIKIYDGPSLIDPDARRIVVILTGLKSASTNTKTGDMLQTWIMLHATPPHTAQKTGEDSAVCGDCRLRPLLHDKDRGTKPCYVVTFQAARSTWAANRDAPVTPLHEVRALVARRKVRVGSYGDPMAVPDYVWQATGSHTAYTHQWKSPYRLMRSTTMASVHSPAERTSARQKGYRTFRIITNTAWNAWGGANLMDNEILCPASKEAGKLTTCARCELCNGKLGINDNRKDIAIVAH